MCEEKTTSEITVLFPIKRTIDDAVDDFEAIGIL